MYNPEVLKLLSNLADRVNEVNLSINDSSTIHTPLKIGIEHTIKEITSTISVINDLISTPIDADGRIDTRGVGSLPKLELVEFIMLPSSKEVLVGRENIRLARAEFIVLYTLASNAGHEIYLGTEHSLLTRLSNIRRIVPGAKSLIESLGKGRYRLNCKFKKTQKEK